MKGEISNLIQLANKGGFIVYKQSINFYYKKNKLYLLIFSNDVSSLTFSKYKLNNIKYIFYLNKGDLGQLLNKEEVSIIGISNVNIAKQIYNFYKKEVI